MILHLAFSQCLSHAHNSNIPPCDRCSRRLRRTVDSSLADPSVTELLTNLDEQISDESSTLRTGNVTSAAKGLAYTTSVVADSTSTSSATAIGLSVVEYQPKGLFGFTRTIWYTTEASGTVTLTIERAHGRKGVMDIGFSTSDGSATGGSDYASISGNVVRFYDGDTSKTVDILLVDDVETEAHFESFTVALNLQGPINEGAALMTTAAEATVYLYDYGDGVVLADATFLAEATSSSAAENGMGNLALGWTITDNGGQSGWVDSNGFAAKDGVFGADEYGRFYADGMVLENLSEWCGAFVILPPVLLCVYWLSLCLVRVWYGRPSVVGQGGPVTA